MMDSSIHNFAESVLARKKTVVFKTGEQPLYEIKANLFKGLAHPYRIRVLEILSATDEASVADMIVETGLEASHLSQHLSVLRRYGLVSSERRASIVYYRLAFPQVADLLKVARQLLAELLRSSQEQQSTVQHLPELPAAR